MLKFLNIANLALIDSLQIGFSPGLNLLSGETGSGKSIIIDALGLLQGARSSPEMIRGGCDRAAVEGLFETEGNEPLLELLAEAGIGDLDEGLLIRRELSTSGRGRILINHQLATINLLKAIQPHIIDLHGQGDQQSLLLAESQLALLDSFAGAATARTEMAAGYEGLLESLRLLEASLGSDAERLQRLDLVTFQVAELEEAGLRQGEDEELEAERRRLASAERLARLGHEAFGLLYEDEGAALSRLGTVERRLTELAAIDNGFAEVVTQLSTSRLALEDVASSLRDYLGDLRVSPGRLQEVEDRLAEIDRLKRKYAGGVEAILLRLDELRRERDALLNYEENADRLRERLLTDLRACRQAASKLSELRRDGARRLATAVVSELADVALSQARWEVGLREAVNPQLGERLVALCGINETALRRTGAETIEFLFSANAGEELRPLGATASGGELSRLMLVLKTVIAPALFPRTLIFDEIDAGIGGRVADAVGLRLKRLAAANQVLCVTHQPLIARYADAHFRVSKQTVDGRTLTSVTELDADGRVEELARMIGGAGITTLARRHARELLRGGGEEEGR